MGIIENIITAFQNVLGNKMRSGLTMLGIVIGIGAVIMITSIGTGLETRTGDQLSQLGLEALMITNVFDTDTVEADLLNLDDLEIIAMPENVEYVAPLLRSSGTTPEKNPNEKISLNISGTSPEYIYAQPAKILSGRFITPLDIEQQNAVVVIDHVLANKLFGTLDCLGQKLPISMGETSFEVTIIGIVEGIDYGNFYDIPFDIYVPINFLMDKSDAEFIPMIYVTLHENVSPISDNTMREIDLLLSTAHNNQERYSIHNMKAEMDMMGDIMGYVTGFVALVASISLVVGGIGVMNIMLVTVTERTREIGIRKSLGATDRNIQTQFLIEAVILTLVGGVFGILLGYVGGLLFGTYLDLTPVISIPVLVGTLLISSAIGIVFGVYPAKEAAKLDPIEALRYE